MLEPIWNQGAEEHVLGAALISSTAADRAFEALRPEHFYKLSHGALFGAMEQMVAKGLPLDSLTVRAFVTEHGIDVPLETIDELAILVPSTSNVAHHAKLVRDAWTKRTLAESIWRLNERLLEMPADEAVAAYEEESIRLADLVEGKHESIIDLTAALRFFEKHLDSPGEYEEGIPTPFSFLEEPLKGGRLYVLGGYQSDGKTAAAMQIAGKACETGHYVGIASLEMSTQDLVQRWVGQRTGVSYRGIQKGNLTVSQRAEVDEAVAEMSTWRCTILDDEQMTPTKLRRIQRGKKFDLLIVDHLHEMEWDDRKHLEKNVRDLTHLARAFNIPVLLLSQLSRSGDWKNPFPRPTMRSLRESGMIEALAAHVWFVWRERNEQHEQSHTAWFIDAKNRFGPSGWSKELYFDSNVVGFTEGWSDAVEVEEPQEVGLPF